MPQESVFHIERELTEPGAIDVDTVADGCPHVELEVVLRNLARYCPFLGMRRTGS